MQKKWHKTGRNPDDVKASDDLLFGEFLNKIKQTEF
jgi:hypothetical protein